MEILMLLAGILIGLTVGFIAGYFFAKRKAAQPTDLSGLGTQIAEIKVKFEEIEKSRNALDREREKLNEERERRLHDWITNTNKLFNEINDKNVETGAEREKRIKELMDKSAEFFTAQKQATQGFLTAQQQIREEVEKKRDSQLDDMKNMIDLFTKTIHGTKTMGIVGEEMLREALHNSIQAGVVATNLKVGGGEVEFAWKLDSDKYIPIDAKLPDVFELVNKYNAAVGIDERKEYKVRIVDKIKSAIARVQKYQNLSNTAASCMLVTPPAVIEIAPEVMGLGREVNVFVCTYKDVFPIAHLLEEQYARTKEEGDVGSLKGIVKNLLQILGNIHREAANMAKAIKTVANSAEEIQGQVAKGNRLASEQDTIEKVKEEITS
jgi:DNA recombination protein RmuC